MRTSPADCVVVGLGQLGRLFGGGALACGVRVTPVKRDADLSDVVAHVEAGAPIFVCVGEASLADVLARVPASARNDVVLVQNELFPETWRAVDAHMQPTVAVVWSNVKRGRPVEIGRATHVFGRHAAFVAEVHAALEIPCVTLTNVADFERELVAKYAFILAVNALGLEKSRTVGEWLDADPARVDAVLRAFVALGEARVGHATAGAFDIAHASMETMRAMPAAGRTARERVERARALAASLGVPLPI